MARIIKDRQVIDDDWIVIAADAGKDEQGNVVSPSTLPAGKVIVPFTYWQATREALIASRSKAELAIWLAPDDEPADVVADFDAITLLAVQFPIFRDGRNISTARLLRERYGWKGEIRAIGDVQRDQIGYMARCGIDAFAVRADKDIDDALNAFGELTVHYQGAVDDPRPLFRRVNRQSDVLQ